MFAVIQTGGKQYKVTEQDVIFVENLFKGQLEPRDAEKFEAFRKEKEGTEVVFDQVIALSDENGVKVGNPVIAGAKVTAKVLKVGRGKKIYVLKYKSKKNEKKRIGHRQPYTKVQILKIEA